MKKIWIIIIAIIVLLGTVAYITPPHSVYPRYGEQTATPKVYIARAVQEAETHDVERDAEPTPEPTLEPTPDWDCYYFGVCAPGQTPMPVPTSSSDIDPDCLYFGICDEGEIPPTHVPAETMPTYP